MAHRTTTPNPDLLTILATKVREYHEMKEAEKAGRTERDEWAAMLWATALVPEGWDVR